MTIIKTMIKNAENEHLRRENAFSKAERILDEIYTLDFKNTTYSKIFRNKGGALENGFGVTIEGFHDLIRESENSIFSIRFSVGGLSGAEGNEFSFTPTGKHILGDKFSANAIPQRGKTYKFENFRYRVLLELKDYKMRYVSIPGIRGGVPYKYTGDVFEWVKFHIRVFRIPDEIGKSEMIIEEASQPRHINIIQPMKELK